MTGDARSDVEPLASEHELRFVVQLARRREATAADELSPQTVSSLSLAV
jgi:hypothetical protein